MKFKKILAVLISAVTIVCLLPVAVSADSIFDTAKEVESGKKISKTLGKNETFDLKFTPTKSGTAKIKLSANAEGISFYVYDEDGNELDFNYDATLGDRGSYYTSNISWDSKAEMLKGTVSFEVKANKTYYVRTGRLNGYIRGTGKFELSFNYPTGEEAPSALMGVTLKKGETLQLTANGSKAKWSSSDKSVASVSGSGLVKAVKKGKAVITVKCGSKSQSIEVTVE